MVFTQCLKHSPLEKWPCLIRLRPKCPLPRFYHPAFSQNISPVLPSESPFCCVDIFTLLGQYVMTLNTINHQCLLSSRLDCLVLLTTGVSIFNDSVGIALCYYKLKYTWIILGHQHMFRDCPHRRVACI